MSSWGLDRVEQQLASRMGRPPPQSVPISRRQGTVTAVNLTAGSVDVDIAGTVVPGAKVQPAYGTPRVGDVVFVELGGTDPHVAGPLAASLAWQPVASFLNSWTNYGAGQLDARYWKDALGIVHLSGMIALGSMNVAAFNLPEGYRPDGSVRFPTVSNNAFGYVHVFASGDVVPTIGSNVWFDLAPVAFRAAA